MTTYSTGLVGLHNTDIQLLTNTLLLDNLCYVRMCHEILYIHPAVVFN